MSDSPSAVALPGRSPIARRGSRALGGLLQPPPKTWPRRFAAGALLAQFANATGVRTPACAQARVIPPADPAGLAGEGGGPPAPPFVGPGGFPFLMLLSKCPRANAGTSKNASHVSGFGCLVCIRPLNQ